MEEVVLGMQDMQDQQNKQDLTPFECIDKELAGLFEKNLTERLDNTSAKGAGSFFQTLAKGIKKKKPTTGVKDYFQRAKELLFDSEHPDLVIAQMWDEDLTLGVCAKPLKSGDVAWKCEDCEKDPTCIICLDCFNNSDHEGHRTWLKTNVGGCCDCGDPEGWDTKGACHKHKGIDSSKDEALNALPSYVREKAPLVMRSLTKILKTSLLAIVENQTDHAIKSVYEAMVSDFIDETNALLASWKQCIFYLSEAYIEVFYGAHKVTEASSHECCHRYFPDDDFREKFEEEKAIFESTLTDPAAQSAKYCTCTVIDLLYQTDQVLTTQSKLVKRITQQCIQLFQSYNFKQHLAFAYIANMNKHLRHGGDTRGMCSLGVQILTMDSVTQRLFRDETLTKMVPQTLTSFVRELIDSKGADQRMYFNIRLFRYDLKYLAKPNLMAQLVQETTLVEDLVDTVCQLHFADAQKNASVMEEFGDATTQFMFIYSQVDLELTSVLESKYLSHVKRNEDVARLLTYFNSKFESLDVQRLDKHVDDGFFLVPLHRLFAFLLARIYMRFYTESITADDSPADSPAGLQSFNQYMVEQGLIADSDQLQHTLELALVTGARQLGFIAELEANRWIYKGERFKIISSIEHEAYQEKYLRMICLFQMAICASSNKSRCVDILISNFCTDGWLSAFLMSLGHQDGPCKEMFQGLANFATEKLASQVQLLFIKLIEVAITEASFLLPSQKKLVQGDSKAGKRLEQMLKGHLRREMMHVLFSQGANATIDQIKKASQAVYLKDDKFTQAVIELSTSQTDASGKKQFRLDQKGKYEAMFDPYYIVRKKQESSQQTAYEQFYKNNPNCNNIVGDYLGNYKYQTPINKECWQAFAQSRLMAEVVSKTVKHCLSAWLDQRDKKSAADPSTAEETFRQELFPLQTLYMGLKLLILIGQNCEAYPDTLDYIKSVLSEELLSKAFGSEGSKDAKLSQIGAYFKTLIYKASTTEEANESSAKSSAKSGSPALSSAEAQQAKKAAALKRKQQVLAKMKKKQKNFITDPAKATATAKGQGEVVGEKSAFDDSVMNDESESAVFNQSCASCQEPLDLNRFFERPFAQLCFLSQSKLLYYTCVQTVESQKQSLQNLRDTQTFSGANNDQVKATLQAALANQADPDEERKTPLLSHRSSNVSDSVLGQNQFLEDDPHVQWDRMALEDLQLRDVVDSQFKTGVAFQKCCHAFHLDCLQRYQTAEGGINFQRQHVKQMIGQDDNCIQCPMCKTFKNTWQPLLPLGLDTALVEEAADKTKPERIQPYVEFCSQLIVNHYNNAQKVAAREEEKEQSMDESSHSEATMSREILTVDIKRDPESFVLQIVTVLSHMVMESTLLRNQTFLAPFDASAQQNDVVLREVVYTLIVAREILRRLVGQEDRSRLVEVGESLLCQVSAESSTDGELVQNAMLKNYQKQVIRLMLISGLCLELDQLKPVSKAIVQSTYSSFKAQVVLADAFRKQLGNVKREKVWTSVQEALAQQESQAITEQQIESQLTYLRAAAASALSLDAVTRCLQQTEAIRFSSAEALQLCLDQAFVDELRSQVDDAAEFTLLTNYLGLDPSLKQSDIFVKPQSLEALLFGTDLVESDETLHHAILTVSCLGKEGGLKAEIESFARTAPAASLPEDDGLDASMIKADGDSEDLICMPSNMHLLTTYFSFNLVSLPADFHSLVKQYFQRQCRGCRKQLQESAICLLCGEIVCYGDSQKCCGQRKGMRKLFERSERIMSMMRTALAPESEGEMSYHARYCEGGNAIFLVPQSATVYMVDHGRIIRGDSPYRNALGETFSQRSAKWDNYLLNEETGGAQVLANLRKSYLEHRVPNEVLQGRANNDKVILRYAW